MQTNYAVLRRPWANKQVDNASGLKVGQARKY